MLRLREMLEDDLEGDFEEKRRAILIALNHGLLAAEGKSSGRWPAQADVRILFAGRGLARPTYLDGCSQEAQGIYDQWLEENRERVEASLNPDGDPDNPNWERSRGV